MAGNSYLHPQQFLSPEDLKSVRALDFKGNIGDPDPVGRMEHWQKLFGGTGEARPYDEGDSPTKAIERMRASVREEGVRQPVEVTQWGDGSRVMRNGHHRAVAAFLEGKEVPARITVYPEIGK